LCVAVLALWAVALPARGCDLRRVADLNFDVIDSKILVSVTINGEILKLAVDTGAGITTLTPDAAWRAHVPVDHDHSLGVEGTAATESQVELGAARDIAVDSTHFTNMPVVIASLNANDAARGALAGLLGTDILRHYEVEFDFPARRMILWQARQCVAGDAALVPDWAGRISPVQVTIWPDGHVQLPLRVEQSALLPILDTGAAMLTLTARAAARAAGGPIEDGPVTMGNAVNHLIFSSRVHVFSKISFAGHGFANVPVPVVDNGRYVAGDGLLGVEPILAGSRLRISYSGSQVFFQK
jgi:predicted aspartyl protease